MHIESLLICGAKYGDNPIVPGRLTCTLVGAGKRRIFAIGATTSPPSCAFLGNAGLISLALRCFWQEGPRLRAKGFSDISSFDLSSATDRWPVVIILTVMTRVWGRATAEWFVFGSLWSNLFYVGRPLLRKVRVLHFTTGQPLGYYGSWALFSLSHHYLVWLAAYMVSPRRRSPFGRYALLGDYIVIADRAVAERYRELLGMLGVPISESKSIDSKTGALEFAKQGESSSS
mgnify:CR=1 FL=1